ncbi:hypothetical protein FEM41_02280 [Jejubacter calystegiae]|uniref:Uncharacterized protein n=1 Tax=Jejubacter calystegiae TaxID=2579935 RepID=A0A4P8YJK4_9ENTR|nr:hypothetical protein [Jejubacter calystegiae]QCT18552.1 hypothetical protein FEM41_02280 [Jejubacter calystegiae]
MIIIAFLSMLCVYTGHIINDDMSALTSVPQKMGAAARCTMGDLGLDIPGLSAARKAMCMQKNGAWRGMVKSTGGA